MFLTKETLAQDIFIPEEFNEEQKMMADSCKKFTEQQVLPTVDQLEEHDRELLTKLLSTAKSDLKVANNAVVKAARKANKKANKGTTPPKQSKWNDFVKVYRSKNEGMSYKDALKEGKTLYNELKGDADKLDEYLRS